MSVHEITNPKKSLKLFHLKDNFSFLKNLFQTKNLPKVNMISGEKGSGKFTLINHFLNYVFDKENYDFENNIIQSNSIFNLRFINNTFQNIIHLSGSDFQAIKTDDIRNLKKNLNQSSLQGGNRFIILDDVDLFNLQSLNALLKIIEEPNNNNIFFLINNKSKPLIDTIRSRCLEIKIILSESKKKQIIYSLLKQFNQNMMIDPEGTNVSAGNFIKFNYILEQNNIDLNKDFLSNLKLFIDLYKKKKDKLFKDLIFFFVDYSFKAQLKNDVASNSRLIQNRLYVIQTIHNFFYYNLNQSSLINNLESNLLNE